MDLRLSPEDRVGGSGTRKKKRGTAKPAKSKSAPKRGTAKTTKANNGGKPQRQKKRRGSGGKKKLTFWRVIGKMFYWGFVVGVWCCIAVAGVVAYYAMQLPSSDTWAVPERPPNIRILAANGQLITNRGQMGGEAVALAELPQYVPAAFIAIEDQRFMGHFGLDPIGILGAMRINVSEGRNPLSGNGGSTITQQLAKNLFLTPEQTLSRKIQEALVAIWLEQNYTKEQILELYLNRMYFGHSVYGIEAAAQRYFGKSARNLSLGEAALLAGSLQAPSRLNPASHPEASATRGRLVLRAMREQGYISDAEAEAAAIDPDRRARTRIVGAENYVADWVETLIDDYIGEIDQDVIVTTTIDYDLQKFAEFQVKEMVNEHGEERNFSQGALVSMDVDGAVKAVVGGTDYSESQYNRAVTARRQSGSAFKPFVYLTAMEQGYTPEMMMDDAEFTYEGWTPSNYGGEQLGIVTLKEALVHSLNTVAARLAIDVGPQNVVNTAMRLGISSPLQPVPSIALGTQSLSLLELTAAYAPFANGGNGVIAHVISRIETPDGQVLYENTRGGPGQVIDPLYVAEMNDMLKGVVQEGTGRAAQVPGWPVAGKTGTTQNSRDALFVGYTARLVTGVWLGNDDDTPTKGLTGGSFPAQLWESFMERALQGMPVADLPGAYYTTPEPDEQFRQGPDQQQRGGQGNTIVDTLNDFFGW